MKLSDKLTLAIMIVGSFLGVFSSTLMNIALPNLMTAFHISVSQVQWVTTGYMLISALVIPASSYLIKKYSMRNLYLSFATIFLLGSILGALAPTFWLVVVGRMIQALGAGVLFPLVMVAGLKYAPKEHRGMVMGVVGMVFNFAPIIGPSIAGIILNVASWRYLFIVLIPVIATTIIAAGVVLPKEQMQGDEHLNYRGLGLLSLSLTAILIGLSNIGTMTFISWPVLGDLLGGIMVGLLFLHYQERSANPVIDLQIFKDRQFNLANSINFLLTSTMFSNTIILTLLIQGVMKQNPLVSAWVILPGALLTGVLSPLSGRWFDRYSIKRLTLIGLSLDILGTILQLNVELKFAFWILLGAQLIRQLGLVMVLIPIQTQAVKTLPPHLIPDAIPAYSMFRQIASSVGTAIIVGIMSIAASVVGTEAGEVAGIRVGFAISLGMIIIALGLSRRLK
ncbi:DHA2 family efflux MFS transporter permease subunit [Convivina intestini]|uniref:DHA2 family efflux MFS transporter permease subunit n=1 Tax=Convivina intestini TaxID=1505726 RepID=UPI00200D843E|nr:DHA2 family efflux MFS transporter permease subunit [Convivina intestini]CAH1853954.1 Colistin resistance protein EmrB [Convivina intestini]